MTHPDTSEFPYAESTQNRFPIVDLRRNPNEIEQTRTPETEKTCRQSDKTTLFYTPETHDPLQNTGDQPNFSPRKKIPPNPERKEFSPQAEQPASTATYPVHQPSAFGSRHEER